jgi:hypothetical protein
MPRILAHLVLLDQHGSNRSKVRWRSRPLCPTSERVEPAIVRGLLADHEPSSLDCSRAPRRIREAKWKT